LWNVTRQVIELKFFGVFSLIHMREQETYQKTFPKPPGTSRRITPKQTLESQSERFGGYFMFPKTAHERFCWSSCGKKKKSNVLGKAHI
jgi:hypothetical protein